MRKDRKERMQPLTESQGMALVALARHTLAAHFGDRYDEAEEKRLHARLTDSRLTEKGGTFVTLKIDDALRGCIGSLAALEPITASVENNALNAAFRDPRFPPLGRKELDAVHIEVSVLSEPVPLAYESADELLSRLRPGVDGVIIQKGTRSATFLPQVWAQLPRPDSFLSNLCLKAGLSADAWRTETLSVKVYQVQYFEEQS